MLFDLFLKKNVRIRGPHSRGDRIKHVDFEKRLLRKKEV